MSKSHSTHHVMNAPTHHKSDEKVIKNDLNNVTKIIKKKDIIKPSTTWCQKCHKNDHKMSSKNVINMRSKNDDQK